MGWATLVGLMRFGFVGCGTISSAMVEGLSSVEGAEPILVSPRNAGIAAGLAARFGNVRVAASNQVVLDGCDVVVLAVRPQIVHEVISELRFRPDHRVISVIPVMSHEFLVGATAPAASVTRAVPLPMVARRQGPTVIYPANEVARELFDRLGAAIELEDEGEFETFTAASAIMSSYFAFAETVSAWMRARGVAEDRVRRYLGEMLVGLAGSAKAAPESSFAMLAEEYQTRGGLNEQVREQMTREGAFAALGEALDGIEARLAQAHPGRRGAEE